MLVSATFKYDVPRLKRFNRGTSYLNVARTAYNKNIAALLCDQLLQLQIFYIKIFTLKKCLKNNRLTEQC